MVKQMGNRRKRYKYTKQEFISICCSKCRICDSGTSPDLCYSELYTMQPKRFIKVVFKNLLEIRKLADKNGYIQLYTGGKSTEYLEYLFRKAFCSANLCGKYDSVNQCENIIGCIAAFRRQVKGYNYFNVHTLLGKNRKAKSAQKPNKPQHRYIAKVYPTFFTNGNADFLKEINEIIYGNKDAKNTALNEVNKTSL